MIVPTNNKELIPWDASKVERRERLKSVTERAKRRMEMMNMMDVGRPMFLRCVPPSSGKAIHLMHRRNEAKYTPVTSACVVIAMMDICVKNISCAMSTSDRVDTDIYNVALSSG